MHADDDIVDAVHAVSSAITVGAVVFDRESGRELLALNADRQFVAVSVVKLLIAVDALRRSSDNRDRVRTMLVHSDDQIANALWVEGDYGELVTRMAELMELRATEPPDTPGRWGNTLLSARDVVRIYDYIHAQLPAQQRELIVGALADTTKVAADGSNQHFGVAAEFDRPWASKQGWGSSADDLVVHSAGLTGKDYRYIVVLLLEEDRPASWPELREATTVAAAEADSLITRAQNCRAADRSC